MISEKQLGDIYGTTKDLENHCLSTSTCWHGYESFKLGYEQTPYLPYLGQAYKDILFCGINLNEGNTDIHAIDHLVATAKQYLNNHKFKIFKQEGYGGSNFYYYVPLLSFLFNAVVNKQMMFDDEDEISWEQILEGFNYCGLTNIIKCSVQTPDRRSKPSDAMYEGCIPKFQKELSLIKPKTIFFFNKFLYPSMLDHYFKGSVRLIEKGRYSISDFHGTKIVELEHPMSTAITRKARFEDYIGAIVDLKSVM